MPIANGTWLGHYEIIAPLGAGGMGEVYRARDQRLGRGVAIKVLPAVYAHDRDRLRRFEQEARATSALNHPNILTIYDLGTHDGAPFIVAELLEGEELRQQLNAGAIPPRQALDYAQQIASGLAAAHEKGIVHRDLKPENLFVTKDGRIKILDFGLAKLKPPQVGDVETQAPTQKKLTDPGVVMGTVGYMSPEQVRGQEADHRADIFSFGVILYEMLSGRRTFSGESAIEVMNAILKEEPPELAETNAKIRPALEKIVRRCLEKRPERRFQTASDLSFALEVLSLPSLSGAQRAEMAPVLERAVASKRSGWRERVWRMVAGVLALGLLALGVAYFRRPTREDAEMARLSITPPDKATSFNYPSISPDGRTLAFLATVEGKTQLWVRPLNSTIAKPLTEVGVVVSIFWSPDSQFIGFIDYDNYKLKKIAVAGGTPEILCDAPNRGIVGTWGRGGDILWGALDSGVLRISANGGAATAVTTVDTAQGEIGHFAPIFFPDGRHFLFYKITTSPTKTGAYLASLDGGKPYLLLALENPPVGVAINPAVRDEGYLIFARQGALLAQPFDFSRNRLLGEPVRLAQQVKVLEVSVLNYVQASVSANGRLVLIEGVANQQLAWFDRTGKRLGTVGPVGNYRTPRLSRDEQHLAVERRDPQSQSSDIHLFDLPDGTERRFTSEPGMDDSRSGRRTAVALSGPPIEKGLETFTRKPPVALDSTKFCGDQLIGRSPSTGQRTGGSFFTAKSIRRRILITGCYRWMVASPGPG